MNKSLLVALIAGAVTYLTVAAGTHKKLKVSDKAPDFVLVDENGKRVHLADIKGDVAVAFFPSAQSLSIGCKKQMCGVRDDFTSLHDHGITMFGLSKSSQKTNKHFVEQNHLPFHVLHADNAVVKAYGVKGFWGAKRYTFLVRDGVVVGTITKVDLKRHAQQIIDGFAAA
jgi:peroxiredoxin Q/BCP